MAKKLLVLATGLWLSTSFCFAQTPYPVKPAQKTEKKESKPEPKVSYGPPRQNIIKLNLLSPIFGTIMAFYQHNLSEENSVQVGVGYMNFDGLGSGYSYLNPHTEAFFLTPEYRYTIAGDNMNGTFIAPFMKYTYMTYASDYSDSYSSYGYPYSYTSVRERYKFTYQTLGVGICLGQQAVYRNKISVDVFAGPVFNMLLDKKSPSYIHPVFQQSIEKIEIDHSINKLNIKGYGIRAGLTVGFLF